VDLEDLAIKGRANRGQLEIGPGALEAGAGDVPAELRSLELGVGEASLARVRASRW
jgi:hypothetical protein